MTKWIALASLALLFTGCAQRQLPAPNPAAVYTQQIPEPQSPNPPAELMHPKKTVSKKVVPQKAMPPKPKVTHKLKKVEDNNFNPDYMYPDEKKTKKKVKTTVTKKVATNTPKMSKATCIQMIGQAKFDKYTQMLGGEAGAIKRCVMLQSMQ